MFVFVFVFVFVLVFVFVREIILKRRRERMNVWRQDEGDCEKVSNDLWELSPLQSILHTRIFLFVNKIPLLSATPDLINNTPSLS